MAGNPIPSDIDILYLHQHCASNGLSEPTETEEEWFITQCGKNHSDGMTDLRARIEAFNVYKVR